MRICHLGEMLGFGLKRDSCESLSSAVSNLEMCASQASCDVSDSFSVISTIPASATTSPATSVLSVAEFSHRQPLKSILKQPSNASDEGFEADRGYLSGDDEYYSDIEELEENDEVYYEGVEIEEESEDEVDEDGEQDGRRYSDSVWDSDASEMLAGGNDGRFMDASFISFVGPSVQFDSHVQFIPSPSDGLDDEIDTVMTVHEMMARNQVCRDLRHPPFDLKGCRSNVDRNILNALKEHACEEVELDKRLLVAYVNGMNGNTQFRSHLCALAENLKLGHVDSPFSDGESATGVYLDQVLCHVIGIFPNIIAEEEFAELIAMSEEYAVFKRKHVNLANNGSKFLLRKIEHLLTDRLTSDAIELSQDELRFFASGIIYVLANWSRYCHA